MRKGMIYCFLVSFIAVFFTGGIASAAAPIQIPRPAGDIYVQDQAAILSPEEKNALRQFGRRLDQLTTAQIAVLTVNSTEPASIDQYAIAAFRQYGLGDPKKNNGVLLVVATQDRKIFVEVGYGLEGALPDGKVGRILDEYAIPYLKENRPNVAVTETYKALMNETAKEYDVADRLQAPVTPHTQEGSDQLAWWDALPSWAKFVLVVGLVFLVYVDMRYFGGAITYTLLSLLRSGRNGGGGGGGSAGGRGGSAGGGGAGRGW